MHEHITILFFRKKKQRTKPGSNFTRAFNIIVIFNIHKERFDTLKAVYVTSDTAEHELMIQRRENLFTGSICMGETYIVLNEIALQKHCVSL